METLKRAFAQLVERSSRPRDIAWLAAFRVLYGTSMAISAERFLSNGWVDRLFVEPSFHFKYWGFGWVEALDPSLMHAFFWVLLGLGVSIAVGLFFRWVMPVFLVAFTYLNLIDVTTYLNHYYLATLLGVLLWLSPANAKWSLDAWLRPRIRRETVATGFHDLFRFQIGVVYTFAGLAKLGGDWLLHAQPLGIWLASRVDLPILGKVLALPHAPLFMSWAGFLFDTTIAWWLLWRRTRPFAYLVVVFFHVVTNALFPIGMFPWIMMGSALVFFPPDWPRKLLRTLRLGSASGGRPLLARLPTRVHPLLVGIALAHCAAQVIIPLRFLAYGGDVRWHEQGMRFSWRVMVREKNGSINFIVRARDDGREWQLSPSRYLTPLQEREMSGQPDLILQLAHHIQNDFRARGLGEVEVRVEALVSLNGRRLAPLIDPQVDLSQVSDGLRRATWILPAPAAPPPRIQPI